MAWALCEAFKVLKAALAAGVNVWNGADFYCTPENNSFHPRNRYFTVYPEDTDKVVHTICSLAELVREGKIGGIQLSEASANTIRCAVIVAKIYMVEAEISLWATNVFENGVAKTCGELQILMVAHTPLGAGMLTWQIKSLNDMPTNNYHRFFPHLSDNFEINLQLVTKLDEMAAKKSCTTAQLALSWIKAHSWREGMLVIVPVTCRECDGCSAFRGRYG